MSKNVFNNTDDYIEFVGNFRPPKRSTRETIKLLLYNREAGTVLGRTGTSWGKKALYFVSCMISVVGLQKLIAPKNLCHIFVYVKGNLA
jgi:hypothetical protein